MSDFLDMGGYAAFVWPAYAISALGIGGLCFFLWRRSRSVRTRLKAAEDRNVHKDNAA